MGLKITTYSTFIYFSQKFFNLQKFNLYCLKAYKNTHQIKFFLKSIYKDSLANPILSFWNRPQMEPDGPLWELFIWPKYAPRAQNTDSTSWTSVLEPHYILVCPPLEWLPPFGKVRKGLGCSKHIVYWPHFWSILAKFYQYSYILRLFFYILSLSEQLFWSLNTGWMYLSLIIS